MGKTFRFAAFVLLVLAASAAFAATTGPAGFPYSAEGAGPSLESACASASSKVADHCPIHGSITTTPHLCEPVNLPGPNGGYLGQLCSCTASTSWCQLFAPPGIPHP
ncbi:MAG TPA: hypothetical protein VMW27_08015 [Thermoanaerobaculia bacterium]|nr:hypothetical protein [Thermoanaerobaculia bacterium]